MITVEEEDVAVEEKAPKLLSNKSPVAEDTDDLSFMIRKFNEDY